MTLVRLGMPSELHVDNKHRNKSHTNSVLGFENENIGTLNE